MSVDRSASVLARLLNRSRSTGENYNLLLPRFAIERLLNRLSVSPHAYPVYTVIAEKFHAMVVLGMNNSRMKDFFDLAVIARTSELDGATLVDSVRATFERRNTSVPTSVPAALTAEFSSNPIKARQWRAFMTKTGLQWTSLDEVVEMLAGFLGPALAARSLGGDFWLKWTPAALDWRFGGEATPRRRVRTDDQE